ncbi:MAG: hypothetical protein ABJB74_05570 [Gemmatimonas sp.]
MQTELAQRAIAPSASAAPQAFGILPTAANNERELELLELARKFLAAVESDSQITGDDFVSTALPYYADDVLQGEFPNHFVPAGAQRDLNAMREAGKHGCAVMREQRFEAF